MALERERGGAAEAERAYREELVVLTQRLQAVEADADAQVPPALSLSLSLSLSLPVCLYLCLRLFVRSPFACSILLLLAARCVLRLLPNPATFTGGTCPAPR
eukprot:COSAG05_NODE_4733_length_1392_cov_0.831400_2_plen_102_part_00